MQEERDNMLVNSLETVSHLIAATNDLAKEVKDIKQLMKEKDDNLIGMTEKIERQIILIDDIEYSLYKNIDKLFNDRQISSAKISFYNEKIKSIENILDMHNLRISRLESKLC